jgi:DNA-binding beta-propeller fold protein YncE
MALVTRDGDSKISVLTVNGNTVDVSKREIHAGLRPHPLGISPRGDFAAITSVGIGNGDADTISLIDLKAVPPRVVDTVSVGQTPESLTVAPDGKHVVVTVINGSSKPPGSPFLNPNGLAPVSRWRTCGSARWQRPRSNVGAKGRPGTRTRPCCWSSAWPSRRSNFSSSTAAR